MKRLFIFISILVFNSFTSYDFKISDLKHEKLKFLKLPIEFQNFLNQPPQFEDEAPISLFIINSKERDRYLFEVKINKVVSSWFDNLLLAVSKKKIRYRINQGVPDPFIIFENKLYI